MTKVEGTCMLSLNINWLRTITIQPMTLKCTELMHCLPWEWQKRCVLEVTQKRLSAQGIVPPQIAISRTITIEMLNLILTDVLNRHNAISVEFLRAATNESKAVECKHFWEWHFVCWSKATFVRFPLQLKYSHYLILSFCRLRQFCYSLIKVLVKAPFYLDYRWLINIRTLERKSEIGKADNNCMRSNWVVPWVKSMRLWWSRPICNVAALINH